MRRGNGIPAGCPQMVYNRVVSGGLTAEADVIAVQLAVTVLTNDIRPDAADMAEANVRRVLALYYPPDMVYVEQVHVEHQASWR